MKKFIIAAVLVFTTGVLASQTKINSPQPTATITIQKSVMSADRKDLASGD
jgi:hypothetical protein